MNVFLAGASGVIGIRLIPILAAAGHRVTAMTRSLSNREALETLGATGVAICDVFDSDRLRKALEAASPEVVISQLTAIPKRLDPRRVKRQMAATNRLRTEGTKRLLEAAHAAGARRAIVQSVAFAYRPNGRRVAEESDPLYTDCPEAFREMVRAVSCSERLALGGAGIEGVVLRYGFFYGPGTIYASDGAFAAQVRRRRVPVVGGGAGVFSFIHVDDAARATLRAVERGPSGVFNIVDDEPAMAADWIPHYARTLGAPPPLRVPRVLGRLAAGSYGVHLMCRQPGASNWRAREQLLWQPFFSSWRTGFEWELAHASSRGLISPASLRKETTTPAAET